MPSLYNSGTSQALAVNHRHLRGQGAPEPPGRMWVGRRRGGKVEARDGACAPEEQLGRGFHPKRGPPALSVSVERGRPLGGQKIAEELGRCLLFPPGSQGAY